MKTIAGHPWYAGGLAFECARCGRCCAGPNEGYVWVDDEEIAALASHLGMAVEKFGQLYLRRVRGRFSLIEQPETMDCIFLQPNSTGARGCSVYDARPTQCRTWPFWTDNLATSDDWAEAGSRCPGINRGTSWDFGHIEQRRRQTKQ